MTEGARETDQPRLVRARASVVRALLRALLLLIVTTSCYLAFLIHRFISGDRVRRYRTATLWTGIWARAFGRITGQRVSWSGPQPPSGSLLCPNHLGYADILAIASVTRSFFVSRADAADWPLVGVLVRSSEQILVSRKRNRGLEATARQISDRLAAGQTVCVFLEGTSTGGDRVLPFLPALVQPAIDCGAPVVPVALRWSSPDPAVVVADDIAYWGDHRFPVHFWRLLGLKRTRVEIIFDEPCPLETDRKRMASQARDRVVQLWRSQDRRNEA